MKIKSKFLVLVIITLAVFGGALYFTSCDAYTGDGVGVNKDGVCTDVYNIASACYCNPLDPTLDCYNACMAVDPYSPVQAIVDTCKNPIPCDKTNPLGGCYDSCMVLDLTVTGNFRDTCPVPIPECDDPLNPRIDTCSAAVDECEDPLNPRLDTCGSVPANCADVVDCDFSKQDGSCNRTVDYVLDIKPLWAAGACITGCHEMGGAGCTNTSLLGPPYVDCLALNDPPIPPSTINRLVNATTFHLPLEHPVLRVKPYAPDSSYLYTIMISAGKGVNVAMPQALPLRDASETNLIKKWICEGACESLDACTSGGR